MGFNISGLAINKNYEKNFDLLQKHLGWSLEKESDINFETASSNWTEEGICDVYFSEEGTLMFINMDRCSESFPLKNNNTLTFALSETSMAFSLNYYESGVEVRSIMEVEGERLFEEGEKLDIEEEATDTSEIIWNQIDVVLGKRFWDIEPDEKASRYVFREKNVPEINLEPVEEKKIIEKTVVERPEKRTKPDDVDKTTQAERMEEMHRINQKEFKPKQNVANSGSSSKKWWQFWRNQ